MGFVNPMNAESEFQIVPSAVDDAETIASLARRSWYESYSGIISQEQIDYMLNQRFRLASLRIELRSDASQYWLAKREGDAVGYGSLRLECDERGFKIQQIYVCLSEQGTGLGRALLGVMIANRRNVKAIRFYERGGFLNVGTKVTDIGRGFVMDDFVMEKNLIEA